MDQYVTGQTIKTLREKNNLTQEALSKKLGVSDKTVSKWETGKGYPDITLLDKIAQTFKISVTELLSGNPIENTNTSSNVLRSKFYVCPVCGNVMYSLGPAMISCHGITLPPLSAEEPDELHDLKYEPVEDELYLSMNHEMTKEHYISFIANICFDGINITKLYPEGNCETRIKKRGLSTIYYYCNKDGLFMKKIK